MGSQFMRLNENNEIVPLYDEGEFIVDKQFSNSSLLQRQKTEDDNKSSERALDKQEAMPIVVPVKKIPESHKLSDWGNTKVSN